MEQNDIICIVTNLLIYTYIRVVYTTRTKFDVRAGRRNGWCYCPDAEHTKAVSRTGFLDFRPQVARLIDVRANSRIQMERNGTEPKHKYHTLLCRSTQNCEATIATTTCAINRRNQE